MDDAEFFTLFVIQNLVEFPESVRVEKSLDQRGILLSVIVEKSDMGRVIGKQGATAHSIRQLLHALGMKHDARYSMKIIDTNPREESDNA